MLKSLPITLILHMYSQKLCPLFFSKVPIILDKQIKACLDMKTTMHVVGPSKFNRDAILRHTTYYDVIPQ